MATYDNNGNMISTLSKEVLQKYPNEIFVETGTLWGEQSKLLWNVDLKKSTP